MTSPVSIELEGFAGKTRENNGHFSLTVGATPSWKDKNSGENRQGETMWFDITGMGQGVEKTLRSAAQQVSQGRWVRLLVKGFLEQRKGSQGGVFNNVTAQRAWIVATGVKGQSQQSQPAPTQSPAEPWASYGTNSTGFTAPNDEPPF